MDEQELISVHYAKDIIIGMDTQEMFPFHYAKDKIIMMVHRKWDHFPMQKKE